MAWSKVRPPTFSNIAAEEGAKVATLFWVSIALVVYHVAVYPALILTWSRLRGPARKAFTPLPPAALPRLAIVMPAYNEAAHIAEKIANLASLRYPADRLEIIVALDGCSDDTAARARAAIAATGAADRFRLVDFAVNRGKVAVLNEIIGGVHSELVALTDVSAMLPPDALERLVAPFAEAEVGVVSPSYRLGSGQSGGESGYWSYQIAIKSAEGAIAGPIGPHGAGYMFRRALWSPLEPDTINDDFVMPMRIVMQGARAVYLPDVVAIERERASSGHDFRRRVRLGAGNLQQTLRLAGLLDLRRGRLAFLFLSGKALRAVVPLLLGVALLASVFAALAGVPGFGWIVAAELAILLPGLVVGIVPAARLPAPIAMAGYAVRGMVAAGYGALLYLSGLGHGVWRRSTVAKQNI